MSFIVLNVVISQYNCLLFAIEVILTSSLISWYSLGQSSLTLIDLLKNTTSKYNGSPWICLFVALLTIFYFVMRFHFQYFWPPSLGSTPKQISEFPLSRPTNLRVEDIPIPKTLSGNDHAGPGWNRRLSPYYLLNSSHICNQRIRNYLTRYYMDTADPWASLQVDWKWRSVVVLKGKQQTPSNKPKKSLKNTDNLPSQKKIQEFCAGILTQDYSTITFPWFYSVNKRLSNSKQLYNNIRNLLPNSNNESNYVVKKFANKGILMVKILKTHSTFPVVKYLLLEKIIINLKF